MVSWKGCGAQAWPGRETGLYPGFLHYGVMRFDAPFPPAGDQPKAISDLVKNYKKGDRCQTLWGITGSGKSYTVAAMLAELKKPALILAPNKSLAAQLYGEMKNFFPDGAVEYFVSYYDYYQPEAYVAASDTYIEKTATINEEIDRLRHAATQAALSRKDAIIVASVSAIYGLGDPKHYEGKAVEVKRGEVLDRGAFVSSLVSSRFERNDTAPTRGQFRVRGDVADVFPQNGGDFLRVEWFDDCVESISWRDITTGEKREDVECATLFSASHYVVDQARLQKALEAIGSELKARLAALREKGALVEAQRLEQRVRQDLEMLQETGWCSGVENYSRHLDGRAPGQRPWTLLDYFPEDITLVIDESHVAVPQVRGAWAGDRSRKQELVDYGFRLPSALDNRPLREEEFWQVLEEKKSRVLFVSATPGPLEQKVSEHVVEQVVRPTGLLDPDVQMRPRDGAVLDVLGEIRATTSSRGRTLVTTLTKASAENLCDYLEENGVKVRYMHSDIDTLERIKIVAELRRGVFDVLVGINLLREGLDLPEVSLVAILDADTEGFLRSETSLVQTIGRAARNAEGRVILYADKATPAIKGAMAATAKRRAIQKEYNTLHKITPKTIVKGIDDLLGGLGLEPAPKTKGRKPRVVEFSREELVVQAAELEQAMLKAADELNYEEAALLRDELVLVEEALNKFSGG